jgi:hypothetical protein
MAGYKTTLCVNMVSRGRGKFRKVFTRNFMKGWLLLAKRISSFSFKAAGGNRAEGEKPWFKYPFFYLFLPNLLLLLLMLLKLGRIL